MTKNKFKMSVSVVCFILIFSFAFSPLLYGISVKTHAAIPQNEAEFDYATVMSEPRIYSQSIGNAPCLSSAELKSMKLYVGGIPFGVKFMTEGILIVGFCDISSSGKKANPSQSAGLRAGDRIISIDGHELLSSMDLSKRIDESRGKTVSVVYLRNNKRYTTSLTPIYCAEEECYKSGVYVKDNGAGIGTVTYVDPQTLSFGGLGHGICEGENGNLVPIQRGSIVDVSINGAVKGKVGAPGEVKGSFKAGKIGTLLKNTNCGIYGVYAALPKGLSASPISLCPKNELKEGKAYIYCTLDDSGPQRYEIEISRINKGSTEGKSFTVKVIDPALLRKTGGIVQGMSGSPIIQNDKLIGAVTHVLVAGPTKGYGISIEKMLGAG